MLVLLHLVSSENTVHTHYLSEYMLSIWASESRPLLMFELQSWVYKENSLLFHLNLHTQVDCQNSWFQACSTVCQSVSFVVCQLIFFDNVTQQNSLLSLFQIDGYTYNDNFVYSILYAPRVLYPILYYQYRQYYSRLSSCHNNFQINW